MSDAYEKVRHGRRPRRDKTIYIFGAISIIVSIALLVPLVRMGSHMYKFHFFLQDLAKSSTFPADQQAICFVDGKSEAITDEQLDALLMLLTDGGCGKRETKLPTNDSARIEFPDGAVLEFWPGTIKDSWTKEQLPALIVSYTRSDGDRYSYLTYKISVKDLLKKLPDAADEWISRYWVN